LEINLKLIKLLMMNIEDCYITDTVLPDLVFSKTFTIEGKVAGREEYSRIAEWLFKHS